MFSRLSTFLYNPWVSSSVLLALGLLLFAALARFLEGYWLLALIAVLGLALVAICWVVVRVYFEARRSERVEAGVGDDERRLRRKTRDEQRSARAWLEQSFAHAVQELRQSRLGAGALYELPWLLVIGGTGEGKSRAIASSGLVFTDDASPSHAEGALHTARLWLANEAVVVDTAGRFLDGDSDALSRDWEALLRLLRKHRPALPANGVVVCQSLTSLLGLSEAALEERARLLRRRLNQIKEVLGVDAPVYLLVTKSDRLEGFAEVAAALGHGRDEPLGWTNPERRFADAGECVREGREARFPDAVTSRGLKHLEELMSAVRDGSRAVRFFLVNRADCDLLRPADAIDPEYGEGLRRAAAAGVELLAYRAELRPDSVRVADRVPVSL